MPLLAYGKLHYPAQTGPRKPDEISGVVAEALGVPRLRPIATGGGHCMTCPLARGFEAAAYDQGAHVLYRPLENAHRAEPAIPSWSMPLAFEASLNPSR
jgi:hypothetical protein